MEYLVGYLIIGAVLGLVVAVIDSLEEWPLPWWFLLIFISITLFWLPIIIGLIYFIIYMLRSTADESKAENS